MEKDQEAVIKEIDFKSDNLIPNKFYIVDYFDDAIPNEYTERNGVFLALCEINEFGLNELREFPFNKPFRVFYPTGPNCKLYGPISIKDGEENQKKDGAIKKAIQATLKEEKLRKLYEDPNSSLFDYFEEDAYFDHDDILLGKNGELFPFKVVVMGSHGEYYVSFNLMREHLPNEKMPASMAAFFYLPLSDKICKKLDTVPLRSILLKVIFREWESGGEAREKRLEEVNGYLKKVLG